MGTVSSPVARRGDGAAAKEDREETILAYQEIVHAQARRLRRGSFSHIPLEDLVSDGQIGLIKAVDTYEPENPKKVPFRVWVIYSVRASIIDRQRRRHYRNETAESLGVDRRSEEPNAEQRVIECERAEAIRNAYKLLPARSRIVLDTRLNGQPLSAAAQRLGITESAVCLLRQQAERDLAHLLRLKGIHLRGI